jgi:diaminopimelate epimerase
MGIAMNFVKMEGIGNDFIVTHDSTPGAVERLIARAANLCDRRRGIGADGLVLVLPSSIADFQMRIINSDGSEAEMCGNGIRCFANYVAQQSLSDKSRLTIETLAGIMVTDRLKNEMVRVNMRPPVLDAQAIPVAVAIEGPVVGYPLIVDATQLRITAVSMGNPHAIIYTETLSDEMVSGMGPRIECHPLFPGKVNVEFVRVLSRSEVSMRVWERGCGETEACGTGACAAAVAGILNNFNDTEVMVHLPGGDLRIEWQGKPDDSVYMTGPARAVYYGTVPV